MHTCFWLDLDIMGYVIHLVTSKSPVAHMSPPAQSESFVHTAAVGQNSIDLGVKKVISRTRKEMSTRLGLSSVCKGWEDY
jgi:hypothetical protein